ncbi:MAG: sigma-70 family RNA polymerase sigma factor [Phycisphaerae bacterium]
MILSANSSGCVGSCGVGCHTLVYGDDAEAGTRIEDGMENNGVDRFTDEVIDVYRTTVRELYAFVSRRSGGSRELAEDVTQETYLRATAAWRRRGLPDCPLAWLKMVARNLLLNHFRRHRLEPVDSTALESVFAETGQGGTENGALVCWGLARVGARHARVLEAFYIDGVSVRGMAENLGISERAVEGRLRRARIALKKVLTPHVGVGGEVT